MQHAFKALIFNQEFRSSQFFFYRRHVKHKAFFHDQVTVLSIKGTKQTCPWKAQTWHKNLRLTQVNTKAKGILTQNNSSVRQSVHGRVVGACRPCYPGVSSSKLTSNKLLFCFYLDKSSFIYKKNNLYQVQQDLRLLGFWVQKKFK